MEGGGAREAVAEGFGGAVPAGVGAQAEVRGRVAGRHVHGARGEEDDVPGPRGPRDPQWENPGGAKADPEVRTGFF